MYEYALFIPSKFKMVIKFLPMGALMKTMWICMFLVTFGNSVCCSDSETETQIEIELELERKEGSVDFCMFEYPYTFSKCLNICHSKMNPSCLGDSMCVCQTGNENVPQNLTMKEILDEETSCKKKSYCDISCKELKIPFSFNNVISDRFFSEGQFCSKGSQSACVCFTD